LKFPTFSSAIFTITSQKDSHFRQTEPHFSFAGSHGGRSWLPSWDSHTI